jgi:hypothetical protein
MITLAGAAPKAPAGGIPGYRPPISQPKRWKLFGCSQNPASNGRAEQGFHFHGAGLVGTVWQPVTASDNSTTAEIRTCRIAVLHEPSRSLDHFAAKWNHLGRAQMRQKQ